MKSITTTAKTKKMKKALKSIAEKKSPKLAKKIKSKVASKKKTEYEIEQSSLSKKNITHGKRRANLATIKSEPTLASQTMMSKKAQQALARQSNSKRRTAPPIRNIQARDSQRPQISDRSTSNQ